MRHGSIVPTFYVQSHILISMPCLAFILMGMLALAGCGKQAPSEMDQLLSAAEEFYAAHHIVEAKQALEQYISRDDKNVQAHWLLAQIADVQSDAPRALKHYSRVIALQDDHVAARIKAARLFLELGDVDRAEQILTFVKNYRPRDAEVLTTEAAIVDRRGDPTKAIAKAEALVRDYPGEVDPILLLNALYARAGAWDDAEKLLSQALQKAPNDERLRFARVNVLLTRGKLQEARPELDRLISEQPDVLPYQARLAEIHAREGRLDDAERMLRTAVQRDPSDVRRVLAMAEFLAQYRNLFAAEQEVLSALFGHPQSIELRMSLAGIYERMFNLDGAERVYSEVAGLTRGNPVAIDAQLKSANLLLRLGEVEEAYSRIAAVLAEQPQNPDALILRGKVAVVRQNFDGAIEDFRAVLQQRPTSLDVLGMLVRAYVAGGQADLAEQGLRSAIKLAPAHLPLRLELVQLLGVRGRYADALTEVEDILRVKPDDPDALGRKVDLHIARAEWAEAESDARHLRDRHPDRPIGYLQLGNIYFMQSLYDRAADAFKVALDHFPLDQSSLNALTQSIFMKEGPISAMRYVEGFLDANPNHPTGYNVLGELYLYQNEHTKAEAAFSKAFQLNPTWMDPYTNLAKLYGQRGEFDAVVQVYLSGLAILPDNIQLTMGLAEAYEQQGKFDDVVSIYEAILAKRPRMDLAANNLAIVLIERIGNEVARRRAVELVERFRRTDSAAYLDTFAWVYFHLGDVQTARETLERVSAMAPTLVIASYHLAQVYEKMGDRANAIRMLKSALEPRIPFRGQDDATTRLAALLGKKP